MGCLRVRAAAAMAPKHSRSRAPSPSRTRSRSRSETPVPFQAPPPRPTSAPVPAPAPGLAPRPSSRPSSRTSPPAPAPEPEPVPVFPHLPLSREEVAQAWRWAEGQLRFPWAQPSSPRPPPPARRRRAEVVRDDGPSRLRDLGLRYVRTGSSRGSCPRCRERGRRGEGGREGGREGVCVVCGARVCACVLRGGGEGVRRQLSTTPPCEMDVRMSPYQILVGTHARKYGGGVDEAP